MEIIIVNNKINVNATVLKTKGQYIMVKFFGIFFEEGTGIKTKIKGTLYNGTVQDVQGDKAIIKLFRDDVAINWYHALEKDTR